MIKISRCCPVGFSLIEFLLILAAVVILLSSVDAWLTSYDSRSRAIEALLVAESAKTNIAITCMADPMLSDLSNHDAAVSLPDSRYIRSVEISGSCKAPRIAVAVVNPGPDAADTTIVVSGNMADNQYEWTCTSTGPDKEIPERCRNA